METGETFETALRRELIEEACVAIEGPTRLHGLFFNGRASRRDHVAVYVVESFRLVGERKPDVEIREARFFPVDALPDGVTASTQRRLEEILAGRPTDEWW